MNIKETAIEIHQNAKNKGFYDKEYNIGEKLMLVVSELGEAIEAHRKGRFADKANFHSRKSQINGIRDSPKKAFIYAFENEVKDTFEDEIADAIIRLFDMAEYMGIDIEEHIRLKMDYNATREMLHGKSY